MPRPSGPAQAYFPHVLIKNTEVKLDFGGPSPSAWQEDKLYGCPSWQVSSCGWVVVESAQETQGELRWLRVQWCVSCGRSAVAR